MTQVYSQVLQEVGTRVDLDFKAFIRRLKAGGKKPGYLRFRGYGRYDSFAYPKTGFVLLGNGLQLTSIGVVKIILHRPTRGNFKTLSIRRDRTGNW